MEVKKALQKARATARMLQLSKFKEIKHVNIPEIPWTRSLFPGTKNDWWYQFNIPLLDLTSAVYELDVDETFCPHKHNIYSEQIIMITKDAEIEVVTFDYIKTLTYPDGIHFKPKEAHAVINRSGKMIRFIILWSPKMEGWQGDFISKNHIHTTPAP